jgi:predicted nucleotidyltransferase
MTAFSAATDERLSLLAPLLYADLHDCALTIDELWRYALRPISRAELEARLATDPVLRSVLEQRAGLVSLVTRPALCDERPARRLRAQRLRGRARRVGQALRYVPFVRGAVLTGSAAADDALPDADVDLLVIVARGRLGTVFAILGPLSRLVGRRLFCPNYYLAEDALTVGPPGIYLARELAQTIGVIGSAQPLRAANPWLSDVMPNALEGAGEDLGVAPCTRAQRLLEAPLSGALGDRLERRCTGLARRRLEAHYSARGEHPPQIVLDGLLAGSSLRFHGGRRGRRALAHVALTSERLGHELEAARLSP